MLYRLIVDVNCESLIEALCGQNATLFNNSKAGCRCSNHCAFKGQNIVLCDWQVNCENHPWLIEPGPGRYLYVKLRGVSLQQHPLMPEARNLTTEQQQQQQQLCGTRNRIALHSGGSVHVVVCPQPPTSQRHHVVEVFSEGWVISSTKLVHTPVLSSLPSSEQQAEEQSRSVIVEFLAHEPGSYSLTWLELARR